MKKIVKRIPLVKQVLKGYSDFVSLEHRVSKLEQRTHNFRSYAIELAADYLVGAQVEGDYCEFGVYKGDTFSHMVRYHELFSTMQFFAVDSFEGLPAPRGIDNENGYTSNFHEAEFAVSEESFLENVKKVGQVPMDRVTTIKGWFDQTLNEKTAAEKKLTKIACAWIDCDFYESTVPVLNFITDKISIGSLLIFDDWKVYRNLPDKGQQLACCEWLERNPGLALSQLYDISHHGRAFTVSGVPK